MGLRRQPSAQQPEDNRKQEKGREAEKATYDQLRPSPCNLRIQPRAELHDGLPEQVHDEDPDQREQQFHEQFRHAGFVAPLPAGVQPPA
jgi:hypothetical protein